MEERTREMHQRRRDVAEQITDMFVKDGFSAVTPDEAARRAGISRGTFYRWFASKEDVVLTTTEATSFDLARSLTAAAASWEQNEAIWTVIRRALDPLTQLAGSHPNTRSRFKMIWAVSSLRVRLAEIRFDQEQRVGRVLSSKFGLDAEQAEVTAAVALTLVELAWRTWAAEEDTDFAAVLDDVMVRANAR